MSTRTIQLIVTHVPSDWVWKSRVDTFTDDEYANLKQFCNSIPDMSCLELELEDGDTVFIQSGLLKDCMVEIRNGGCIDGE